MNIIIFLIFTGIVLVSAAVVLFAFSVRNRDMDRVEQLSLMPLDPDDDTVASGNRQP